MGTHESRSPIDADGAGIEILPGVVCVDLTVIDPGAITVDDLRDAMAEATAQEGQATLVPEELLGDFDINPL